MRSCRSQIHLAVCGERDESGGPKASKQDAVWCLREEWGEILTWALGKHRRKALEPGSLIADLKKPKMLGGSREHVQPGTGSEPGTSAGMRDSATAQQALAV